MLNDLIQAMIDHPHRKPIVWAVAIGFSFLFVVPAWDFYSGANRQRSESRTELREISYSIENINLVRVRLNELKSTTRHSHATITENHAESLRDRVTELAHQTGCRIRRLTMSDALVRTWAENDDPASLDVEAGLEETEFQLETRTLAVSADGNLKQLTELMSGIIRLDRFAVPSHLTIQRRGIDGHLSFDAEISLFNLTSTFD